MIATVVGFERVEFSGNDGRTVSGTRLYINYEDDLIKGQGADSKFFSDDAKIKLPEIVIGRKYDFNYQTSGFSGKARLLGIKAV